MIDESRARKIERIRKLLTLAKNRGASDHEAATALQMAQAQMEAEGITTSLKRVTVKANKTRRADLFCQGWIETAVSKARRLPRAAEHDQAVKAFKQIRYGQLVDLVPVDRNRDRTLRDYEIRDLRQGRRAGDEAELRIGMGVGDGRKVMLSDGGRS